MKNLRSIAYLCVAAMALCVVAGCRSSRKAVRHAYDDPIYPDPVATVVGGGGEGGGAGRTDDRELLDEERRLVDEAMTWLGTPYRYGGQDYGGTDCSGMTMEVYRKALGIKLPRTSSEQQRFCRAIAKSALSIGDLLFFCTGGEQGRVSHVGLYLGNGRMIHSSGSKGVIISNIEERYYLRNYHSSGHVVRPSDRLRKPIDPRQQPLETDPLRFDLDREVELRIDSIYSAGE